MMKLSHLMLIGIFIFSLTGQGVSQEKVKFKNAFGEAIEIKIFSESEQKWLKPSIKIEKGKFAEYTFQFKGDHNLKLIVGKEEFLLGTYDFQAALKQKKIDEIEVGFTKLGSGKPLPQDKIKLDQYKDGDIVETTEGIMKVRQMSRTVTQTKTRMETRTRTVMVTTATGVRPVEQTYTVAVPYTETVEQQYRVLEPVESGKVTRKGNRPGLVFRSKGKPVEIKDSLKK